MTGTTTVGADAPRDAAADVAEQPAVVARFLEEERASAEELARRLRRQRFRYIVTAGRGSSDNAVRYAQYLFGAQQRLPVAQSTPSLFTRYGMPPNLEGALVVAVSRSGESRDVVAVVEEARRQGRPTVAFTNTPGSSLAAAAEHVLHLHAGSEAPGIATKSYVASLAAFALLSASLSEDEDRLDDLRRVPEALAEALEAGGHEVAAVADALAASRHLTVIGRGFNLATANEIALKLTLLTQTSAMAYSAADLIRGPDGSGEAVPVLLVAPSGRVLSDVMDLLPYLRSQRVRLVALSDVPEVLAESDHRLALPHVREWLSPLVAVAPGQLLALELARRLRG